MRCKECGSELGENCVMIIGSSRRKPTKMRQRKPKNPEVFCCNDCMRHFIKTTQHSTEDAVLEAHADVIQYGATFNSTMWQLVFDKFEEKL